MFHPLDSWRAGVFHWLSSIIVAVARLNVMLGGVILAGRGVGRGGDLREEEKGGFEP